MKKIDMITRLPFMNANINVFRYWRSTFFVSNRIETAPKWNDNRKR